MTDVWSIQELKYQTAYLKLIDERLSDISNQLGKQDAITVEEFETSMQVITNSDMCSRDRRIEQETLIVRTLQSLGYGKDIVIFNKD